MQLTVEVDPSALGGGEHKAEIRVVVPAAFRTELKIPIVVTVVEP